MRKYIAHVPYQSSMGSISPIYVTETPMNSKEDDLLWQINSMRDHDGLKRWERIPKGVKFQAVQS